MCTRIDGHGWTDTVFSMRATCATLCVEEREGGKGVVELSEWNNQARIKRPLVHMRGISLPARLSPPSGRTIRTRDNYCNYSARNSRAESAQGYVKSRPFPCKCPLARFHALLASCVPGSRACVRNTWCVTRISGNLRRSRRGLCLSSGEYMQINPMWIRPKVFNGAIRGREGGGFGSLFLPVVPVFEKRMKLLELYINTEYIYIQCNRRAISILKQAILLVL